MRIDDIFDENVLIDIFKTTENHDVRVAAVKKINDREILIDIARTDEDKHIRRIATEKLVKYWYKIKNKYQKKAMKNYY